MRTNYRRIGNIQRKILVLLQAGLALGLTNSPEQHFKILCQIPNELRKIDIQSIERAIRGLYKSNLVEERHNKDGTTTMILNKNGKKEALRFNLETMEIKKPAKWDKKWRIVMFDVPEKMKRLRDSLRFHFQTTGFIQLQKSVFVHPYPCEKEIEFITEFYNSKKYIRFVVADSIDNELDLKRKFSLL